MDHVAGIPVRHPEMVALGRHYGCKVETCVPFDPESKGGVEATVKIAKADLVPSEANLLPAVRQLRRARGGLPAVLRAGQRPGPPGDRGGPGEPAGGRAGAPAPAAGRAVRRSRWARSGWSATTRPIRFGSVRYSTPPGHAGTRVWCRVAGDELVDHRPHRPRGGRDRPAPPVDPGQPAHPRRALPAPPRRERAAPAPAAAPHRGRGRVPGHRRRRADAGWSRPPPPGAAGSAPKMARAVELAAVVGAGKVDAGPRPGRGRRPVRRRRPGLDHRPPGRRAGHRPRAGHRRRGPLRPARHRRLGRLGEARAGDPPAARGHGPGTADALIRPGPELPARS